MLLAICEKKLAIFASTGNYFRPWISCRTLCSLWVRDYFYVFYSAVTLWCPASLNCVLVGCRWVECERRDVGLVRQDNLQWYSQHQHGAVQRHRCRHRGTGGVRCGRSARTCAGAQTEELRRTGSQRRGQRTRAEGKSTRTNSGQYFNDFGQ